MAAGKISGALGGAINLPGALETARNYVQTRGVVRLQISSNQIATNSSFDLFDTTTQSHLVQAPAGSFGLGDNGTNAANSSWALTDSNDPGYQFTLSIFPLDPNFTGKFAYGANDLVLNVDEQTAPKEATQTVTMQDFTYFTQVYAAFPNNEEQSNGFEGGVSTISGPFVSNDTNEISNELIGMINR